MTRGALSGLAAAALLVAGVLTAALAVAPPRPERPGPARAASAGDRAQRIERGRYLARIGDCAGCHTAPGGEPLAGGYPLETRYGTFHTPNITPDAATGIGDWSREQFRDALLRGRRPDGAALYPACPYPSYTRARARDIDAIFAWLQSLPGVENRTRSHDLDFPYGFRPLVNAWQWLFFEPGPLTEQGQRSERRQRGRYLVESLGHCNECHRERGAFGQVREADTAPGGMVHGWYAPSLASPDEAGLQDWPLERAADFLTSGRSDDAVMLGPMAGVVHYSLQHVRPGDARAMAAYLVDRPRRDVHRGEAWPQPPKRTIEPMMEAGGRLYGRHCAGCHGEGGQGEAGVVALAGNRTVTQRNPANVVRMIRAGGFPASTPGNPYPHGMPPSPLLSDPEIAAVATYIRRSGGNDATAVSTIGMSE